MVAMVDRWKFRRRGFLDAIDFRQQARDAFAPSMRQKIDVADLYADALAAMPETIDGQLPIAGPDVCPVTLDELLGEL